MSEDRSGTGNEARRAPRRAAAEQAEASCELRGGTLTVTGPVGLNFGSALREKCQELLAAGEKELLVDLSLVLSLSSIHLGMLGYFLTQAKRDGKTVVIRAHSRVLSSIGMMGLGQLAKLEEAEE